jgi:hypothetical protein
MYGYQASISFAGFPYLFSEWRDDIFLKDKGTSQFTRDGILIFIRVWNNLCELN